MQDWSSTLIPASANLREALMSIDGAASQIALVIDETRRLIGTITDGDIRRGLIRGLSLESPVSEVMNRRPKLASPDDSVAVRIEIMRDNDLRQLPIVNQDGLVLGLDFLADLVVPSVRENTVVIMAGGLGTRLKALTRNTPKSLLELGPRPLLETIIRNLASQGFYKFMVAVNHKSDQIEAHFGDGTDFDVSINYLREKKRLGTAGPLSLLKELDDCPYLVTNSDVLTDFNYAELVDSHQASGAIATVATREYEIEVPFGVITEEKGSIISISEKPAHRFLISAGINVLDRQAIRMIPSGRFFDMPDLINLLIESGKACGTIPVNGYWIDIGRPDDFHKANADFPELFD